MKQEEFLEIYSDLAAHFGQTAFSAMRGKLLFDQIQNLDAAWFRKTAHKMIIANDGRFDIYASAKQELGSRMQAKRVEDEVGAVRNFNRITSEMGKEKLLEKLGAKSLWDAVEKRKGMAR